LAWSPDGESLAAGSYKDGMVRLWHVRTGKLQGTLKGSATRINGVAWSPDGKIVACGAYGPKGLLLWDAVSGKLLHQLQDRSEGFGVAFSPDGRTLLSASPDTRVRLWDVASGQLLNTLEGHTKEVNFAAWRFDGQAVVSVSRDMTLRVWGPAHGDTIRMIRLPTADADPSPDGRLVASRSTGFVQVWDVETGRPRGTLVPLGSQWLVIGADGHYRGSPRVERELVYVVQTDQGQETLSPEEFSKKYGWKNDPDRGRLLGK
jgi:WD40 repeat protein